MSETMNARDFMRTMENLINSPTQKLIGSLDGGLVYANEQNPELMYAAAEISKAKNEVQELKEKLHTNAIHHACTVIALRNAFVIKKAIFNNPATIVYWNDGTKTVVKAENEDFDPEKGLAMAIAKKAYGNVGSYYNQFKKFLPKDNE